MKTTLLSLVATTLGAISSGGAQTLAKVSPRPMDSSQFVLSEPSHGMRRRADVHRQHLWSESSDVHRRRRLLGRNRSGDATVHHGPARVDATVINGEVTRLRAFVGPVPSAQSDIRTISATATDAAVWLSDLLVRAPSRVASQAVLPLMIADAPEPWPLLLRVARDGSRPREVARSALHWLSSGVTQHLRLGRRRRACHDDDQMRAQAVFVLSQRAEE